ncbi:MBL fold metallo-hydrolase [Pelomonas sp. SE-A7]|uniref:ComEC/Rec2 family competence protein n=1 Tax=Pelomonas sp. SE-A7 TaxID=3054953 RepID=UPI00259CDD13|nr:MBL fold metallo-hydrolase [Pelomonas sp. SE-A7]MDM4767213.1 MBL fold metallo-hydrolase [Pelomonas sp. SE-A7]
MATRSVIAVDLADVWEDTGRKQLLRTLAWGDEVMVKTVTDEQAEVEFTAFVAAADGSSLAERKTGYIKPLKSAGIKAGEVVIKASANKVLRVNFVDVQQGDGAVIESPKGKLMLVDGGDNQMFARYLAGRYPGTSLAKPKVVDCILVTHGDADHFEGLVEIKKSETNATLRKRLFMQPLRVYHNGIVKRPSTRDGKSVPDTELLGPTVKEGSKLYLNGLVDNLLKVPDTEMNKPFREWKAALAEYHQRSPVEFRRLAFGDDEAFDFFNEAGVRIECLGPLVKKVGGKPALPFLGEPPKGPRIGDEATSDKPLASKGKSASHTINGHSIVFRLSYGGFSYLFCGDLNDESSRFLVQAQAEGHLDLRSEVFKVPHHGSADFSGAFIKAVEPVVSVVSSGDESARKEYVHPRATLMGALGRYSRVAEPLVFVTELVAFFQMEGWSKLSDAAKAKTRGEFFGFSRAAYGIVKTRTDGQRLLVYTDSANLAMKEAYAFELDEAGAPRPAAVRRV